MQVRQILVESPSDSLDLQPLRAIAPQLLLVFADCDYFLDPAFVASLGDICPDRQVVGCSTAGEIAGEAVYDKSAVLTAVHFDGDTRVRVATAEVAGMDQSFQAGATLGAALKGDGLQAVLVFGQGVNINGSGLIEGMASEVGQGVSISGGLGGDGGAFTKTYILSPAGVSSTAVVGIGLYGSSLTVGTGSFGGWNSFGPVRKVTRCAGNILYELDGEPALDIYRSYLGDYAKDLPASGLLFPFEMLREDHSTAGLIRTILGIDEEQGALILAGDIDPEGYLRLMHASTDALVDGAEVAATRALAPIDYSPENGLGILVSCVGRKLVMGDRVDEEVESVLEVLGERVTLAGFYSYGEISPFGGDCKLHNQTMTVTLITEA